MDKLQIANPVRINKCQCLAKQMPEKASHVSRKAVNYVVLSNRCDGFAVMRRPPFAMT